MPDKQKGLRESWEHRKSEALQKAKDAIKELEAANKAITFSSVSTKSGVSRSFLYDEPSIRKVIEKNREAGVNHEINRRAKYDKTAQSKDVIIQAKDRRIRKLETENEELRAEVQRLRGLLYSKK
ncbi:MAG: DUF6262 family protein [Clostridiales bacterium]|nr:DUF6262 family protein [Clostridiales bacterium]